MKCTHVHQIAALIFPCLTNWGLTQKISFVIIKPYSEDSVSSCILLSTIFPYDFMNEKNGVIVQSLARAMMILDCFAGERAELGIKEISEAMGLSKSTVYGLVNTLVAYRYLEQNPENKRYRLGIRLFEMGMLVQRRMSLQREARPYAKELGSKYNATCHIAALYDNSIIYIDKVDSPGAMILYSHVGKNAPCNCSGVGKAITAFLPPAEQDRILENTDLSTLTENTLTDPAQIRLEWAVTAQRGYAIDNEEIEIGLRCVAAPIFGYEGRPIAAMSVSASSGRLSLELLDQVAADVKAAAAQISRRLSGG